MSYVSNASTALNAQVSLAAGITASKQAGSSGALIAETGLASAAVQDGAWVAKVESLLAPPIVSIALSDAAQKLMANGPGNISAPPVLATSPGATVSKTA